MTLNKVLRPLCLMTALLTGCDLEGPNESGGQEGDRYEIDRAEIDDGVLEIVYDRGRNAYFAVGQEGVQNLYELYLSGRIVMSELAAEQLTKQINSAEPNRIAQFATVCDNHPYPMYASVGRTLVIKASARYESPDFGPQPFVSAYAAACRDDTGNCVTQYNTGYAGTSASAAIYAPPSVPGFAMGKVQHVTTGCIFEIAVRAW